MLLTSEDKNSEKIKYDLLCLWRETFGDEEDYIGLIFEYLYDIDVFCKFYNKKIVSAFYLFNGEIISDNKIFKGKNLYAAATLKSHRGKGYMSELINEALCYCKDRFDFIVLTPGEKSLYDYYEKFGFEAELYKYESEAYLDFDRLKKLADKEYIFEKRKNQNSFLLANSSFSYAFACYTKQGINYYEDENGNIFLVNKEENEVVEFIPDKENIELSNVALSEKYKFSSKNRINDNSEYKSFGMIYSFNEELKNKKIYNNSALE